MTVAVPPENLRDVMRTVPTGVTVVTTRGPVGDRGMTATSFTSVSLRPPLVSVSMSAGSRTLAAIAANAVFAVNVLAAGQEPLLRHFASPDRAGGARAFEGFNHGTAVTGSPILAGVGAYLDCEVVSTHRAGDHEIVIGEVLALGFDATTRPLVFHAGACAPLAHPPSPA